MDGVISFTDYQIVFAEEFADFVPYDPSTRLGVWTTRYHWGPETVINKELQYYIDISSDQRKPVNPFRVEKGSLVIEARPANPEDARDFNNQRYTSGAITTKDTFSTTYGYFEIRAQMPAGKGLWPAFWLMPADKSTFPELDVVEMIGDKPNELVTNLHYHADGEQKSWQTFIAVPDMSRAYHTYAANWAPDAVTWYFDGRPVAYINTPPDMHKPMYLLVNLAIGGSWPGSPDATTKFPAQYRIDYVRAYRHKSASDHPVRQEGAH